MEAISIATQAFQKDMEQVARIGQNMVNMATPGYRSVHSASSPVSFATMVDGALNGPPASGDVMVDMTPGAIFSTAKSLDLAIDGKGFFVLRAQGDAGWILSRRGDFSIDAGGRLVSQSGLPVMGQSGDIVVNSSNVRIAADGKVFDNERQVDQLRIVEVEDSTKLKPAGQDGFFAADAMEDVQNVRILSGFLEGSNVNSATEMVKLVELMRHMESTQKLFQYHDEMLGKSLSKFGEI